MKNARPIPTRYPVSTGFTSLLATAALTALTAFAQPAQAQSSFDLEITFDKSQQCRVTSDYAHSGEVVVLKSDDNAQTQSLPLQVRANMKYIQRYTGNASENQAIRYYETAKSDIQVAKGDTVSELSDANRYIVTRISPKSDRRMQLASLGDALRQSELDMLRNPGDPLTLAALFNRENLSPGDKWDAAAEPLADFLAVDRIISSDVQLLLKSMAGDEAKIYFAGKVRAEVDDVVTNMEVSGVLLADVRQKTFSSLRLAIREDRQRGQLAPGFVGLTKVDLRAAQGNFSDRLSTKTIRQLTADKKVQQRLKWVSESGRFELQYDPTWRMIASEQEAAILRYLSNGELMAQCNVVRLPSRPASKPLTLAAFKTEVGKMLKADEDAKIDSADELRSRTGMNVLEVQVSGSEEGVPLTWMYFHASHDDGRCVTFVFTLEQELVSDVRPVARRLVNSLTFLAKPARAKSASAKSAPLR